MKKWFILFLLVVTVGLGVLAYLRWTRTEAEIPEVSYDAPLPEPPALLQEYRCDDGERFSVQVRQGQHVVFWANESARLQPDGDGIFTNGSVTFTRLSETRGHLETPRRTYTNCATEIPLRDSPLQRPGATFLALGHDAGWSVVTFGTDSLIYTSDYSRGEYLFGEVTRTPQANGDRYRARLDSLVLELAITNTACTDSTENQRYPATVIMTYDGVPYPGCGRPLR